MSFDELFGCAAVILALLTVTILVFWSRSMINKIADGSSRSAREILKDMNGDR